jgi:O-methyltransferase
VDANFGCRQQKELHLASKTGCFYPRPTGRPGREIAGMKRLIKSTFRRFGLDIVKYRNSKITKPMDESYLEVLTDQAFQASVDEVKNTTLLDTARLANLWQLCRISNPSGSLIEIGSYKGGGALHISNSCPGRTIFVCDTFEGFGDLPMDPSLDHLFARERFRDTSFESVKTQWANKGRDVRWVKGYFPESAAEIEIANISFVHIDLDIYESTANALNYLRPRLIDQSIVVFDDYLRGAHGVVKAAREFSAAHPDWTSFPIFPGQGLMVHRSWFG